MGVAFPKFKKIKKTTPDINVKKPAKFEAATTIGSWSKIGGKIRRRRRMEEEGRRKEKILVLDLKMAIFKTS